MKQTKEQLKKKCRENLPKYKIGDIVAIEAEFDKEKIIQGIVKTAEFMAEWFYGVEISGMTGDEKMMTYSYEVDTGDAKTKILYKINQ